MDGAAAGFGAVAILSDTTGAAIGAGCVSAWKAIPIPKRPVESTWLYWFWFCDFFDGLWNATSYYRYYDKLY